LYIHGRSQEFVEGHSQKLDAEGQKRGGILRRAASPLHSPHELSAWSGERCKLPSGEYKCILDAPAQKARLVAVNNVSFPFLDPIRFCCSADLGFSLPGYAYGNKSRIR